MQHVDQGTRSYGLLKRFETNKEPPPRFWRHSIYLLTSSVYSGMVSGRRIVKEYHRLHRSFEKARDAKKGKSKTEKIDRRKACTSGFCGEDGSRDVTSFSRNAVLYASLRKLRRFCEPIEITDAGFQKLISSLMRMAIR